MWRIWKEEVYKIVSRKIIWCGIIVLMVFLAFRLYVMVLHDYSATIEGQAYHGIEAIHKDQELAKKYAGPLTEEKVKDIYKQYGFYYIDEETWESKGNYCNQFITEKMTNYNWTNRGDLEEIAFLEDSDWENNVTPLLKGDIQFDYVYGWDDFRETYGLIVILMFSVILIIGLSPIFSEEYSLRTAEILLTTCRGKKSGIWMKILAAMSFAAAAYCFLSLYTWLIYFTVFGTQGLDASAVLIGVSANSYHPDKIGGFFLYLFGLGLVGVLLLTALVLAVSSICKNSFMAVVVSLIVFLVPLVWVRIFAPMWVFGIMGTKMVSHFMVSMPVYLAMNWGFPFAGKTVVMHIMIGVIVGAVGIVLGYKKYRNYQG